ncbi:serinethreonine phosphatase [Nitzschia inconspicua]|uniref:Serinethreonine phosphatase n=1 Tax=Nitzschia inconspicua TaxID=303405 RepID=A0A9K3PH99_9STRA|nr:serinethreonine phosphatase [Nitzschia inconspicua]
MASCATTRAVVTTSCRVRTRSISSSTSSTSPPSSTTAPATARNDVATLWRRSPTLGSQVTTNSRRSKSVRGFATMSALRWKDDIIVTVSSRSKANISKFQHSKQHTKTFSTMVSASPSTYNSFANNEDSFKLSRVMMLSAVAVMATSWNFVTTTSSPGPGASTAAAPTATTIGRGGSGGGGGGGSGGGGGAMFKTIYPGDLSEKRAEADVRQWEEDTESNPFEVSDSAVQGARWTMEDTYIVANGGHFVAVFDGHGGADVSSLLRDRVHKLYKEALPKRHLEESEKAGNSSSYPPSVQSHIGAIRSALNRVERDVLKVDDLEYQGSTAVVVLVHQDDDGERTLVAANVGDSRAILSRSGRALDLTKDHKPCDEREKARIRSMGADIEWDPYGQLYRVNDLSLSRAIGDRFAKPVVSSEAEIDCLPIIDGKDEFFLLASDGLWDVMTSQEVVDFVHHTLKDSTGIQTANGKIMLSPEMRRRKMARILANEALERGSADNVCVVLVWLKN